MREYLFRGKRLDNGEWVEGFFVKVGGYCYILTGKLRITNGHIDFVKYNVDPETVGQHTGLIDKNEKPIFEGDIVRQYYSTTIKTYYDPDTLGFIDAEYIEGHHIGVVEISAHKGTGMRNPISYDDIQGTKRKVKYFVNLSGYRCEVIGNIHDNKEILKEGRE